MWKRILATAHRFGFTRNETAVVLFLSAVIITGTVLTEVRYSGARPVEDVREAYRSADSVFTLHAQAQPKQTEALAKAEHPAQAMSKPKTKSGSPSGVIDLNAATEAQLTTLPGIGPVTAKKILAYRQEHGSFQRSEDLMKVKSIGPRKYERIREFITIE